MHSLLCFFLLLVLTFFGAHVATSFAWDAAGALFNALLILLTGAAILPSLRRFAHRLEPAVELV